MEHIPVQDITIQPNMTTTQLIEEFQKIGGFTAQKLAHGTIILKNMIQDPNCTVFLSFPACLIATGTRGVITQLVKNNYVDVLITTCGTLDHDLARLWKDYYHGSFLVDDKKLHKKGIHRLGNVFIPLECYGTILEEKLQPLFRQIFSEKTRWATRDLIWKIGKLIEDEPNAHKSILYWAYKNQIPIYIPGIMDGAFGSQLWMFYQNHRDLSIDLFADEQHLSNHVFDAKKTGAFVIGGGISKHHTIWWNQFKGGLDYVVYVTTASEFDGSLSGAQTREAISWGKITEKADDITIEGDASILVPLIMSAIIDELK